MLRKLFKSRLVETPKELKGMTLFRYEKLKNKVKNKMILELGSGLGQGADLVFKMGAREVLGLDYEPVAIRKAKEKFERPGLKFQEMDVIKIGNLKQKFDLIIAFELIEHLSEGQQQELVRLVKNRLKQNGRVIISTPNRLVFSRGKDKSRFAYHLKELTVEELRELFKLEFGKIKIKGVKCVNQKEVAKRKKLEISLRHRLVDWLTSFKWVCWLMPLIPKKIKALASGEGNLSELKVKDFKLVNSRMDQCGDLWLEARA